jgi:hypothetical protein
MTLALSPGETELVGQWVFQGTSVLGDPTCKRIEALVATHLVELRRTADGWSTLYRDPGDGRLWEHTYPQGHMHGGGPPALQLLSAVEAQNKYGDVA